MTCRRNLADYTPLVANSSKRLRAGATTSELDARLLARMPQLKMNSVERFAPCSRLPVQLRNPGNASQRPKPNTLDGGGRC
jgi:hypothetical protein